jgi:hypothetical protein
LLLLRLRLTSGRLETACTRWTLAETWLAAEWFTTPAVGTLAEATGLAAKTAGLARRSAVTALRFRLGPRTHGTAGQIPFFARERPLRRTRRAVATAIVGRTRRTLTGCLIATDVGTLRSEAAGFAIATVETRL